MTLDEAIKHSEEVAEEHTRYNRYGGFESWNDINCTECAKEHRQLANWLKELKQLREQEPCEDVVSRKALIERINNAEDNFIADHQDEMNDGDSFCDGIMSAIFNIREMVAQAPSVTPTHIETVTEFADRCRECGKTAITRAENDEILNEAWHLMQNATEEDGEGRDKNL